ncbi:endonuclease/exonuclease/phosphatase family protein [Streptomyces sp. NBC_00102]|uniref:endonuclease/exonuclease/phosphatase family protein n=1 Tax=Streptomyces sp. NBC_00102 TaxID=2975652 RepID=UPI00224F63AA|nr:endonuclease/exonuclease/phosphatase family protein [Streptomyces sp. NBC_00102]MCX5401517.1 endonuclease/exonuclease/phosphatase family protein [Streptomyces sp. NBC_00102]
MRPARTPAPVPQGEPRAQTAGPARRRWHLPRRGKAGAALAVVVAVLLAVPRLLPNTPGRLGSLLETLLPWLGLAVPVLLCVGLLRRAPLAVVAVLLPALVWGVRFGGLFLGGTDGSGHLVVVQHNVSDENADPVGTAAALNRSGARIVALEELTPQALPVYEKALAPRFPHHAVSGTVGLWSAFPLADVRPVDIRPDGIPEDWNRGLRATARTPDGDLAVYVAHLPSIRIGATGLRCALRDESAALLAGAIRDEPLERVLLLGDLNSTVDDRGLRPLRALLDAPASGVAFSWPGAFPLARIDQVLARSVRVTGIRALPATGSDHLPVAAYADLRTGGAE